MTFSAMRGRLNAFQKSMLQWNQVHPYSAVHVMKLAGGLSAGRMRSCIENTLSARGLTNLSVDSNQFTFEYGGGWEKAEIAHLADNADNLRAILAEVEKQLNLPFPFTGKFSPFRFIIAPGMDSFYLGIVYFHPVADAESVVDLLKEIASAYASGADGLQPNPVELYPPRARLLVRQPMMVVRKLLMWPAQMRSLRQSYRVRVRDVNELRNGFSFFSLKDLQLQAVLAAGKSWNVTVNDVFLALLMKALSPMASGRIQDRKRRKISVGCIVNARKDLGLDRASVFGLFLGSFTVAHEVPEGMSTEQLAREVRQQTAAIKQRKLYLAAPMELGLASFVLRFFSPEGRKKFYAKNYPLWGGITNMNLNSISDPNAPFTPLDYFRGVSTGPVTPLVLSVTTIRDRVNIGVSYRTAVFEAAEIQKFQERFVAHLEETM